MQVISNTNTYPRSQWVLMIEGIEQPVIFRSFDLDSAGKWADNYIKDNFTYRPNWKCTTKINFKEKKWTYGKLDGKWYRATDFTKGIIDTSKVLFKSNKQFKNK